MFLEIRTQERDQDGVPLPDATIPAGEYQITATGLPAGGTIRLRAAIGNKIFDYTHSIDGTGQIAETVRPTQKALRDFMAVIGGASWQCDLPWQLVVDGAVVDLELV